MVEKINEPIKRRDLDLIIEVNRKAIDIESEVAGQNEEIIDLLSDIKKEQESQAEILGEIKKQSEDTNKDLFKIQVLFVTGLLSLVIQIIQMFLKK